MSNDAKYPIVCAGIALKQHFQYLWNKRGWLSTLRSRPAVWWSLGSNIGVVASVKSTTETNVIFSDTLKLLMFRPVHTLASSASRNSKPGGHCKDMKLLCTNNASVCSAVKIFLFSFCGATQNWWICWEAVCSDDGPWRAEILDMWSVQQGAEPQARSYETCRKLPCGDQSLYLPALPH